MQDNKSFKMQNLPENVQRESTTTANTGRNPEAMARLLENSGKMGGANKAFQHKVQRVGDIV